MSEKERILQLETQLKRFKAELHECGNELCYKCGSYRQEHNGACDGCRWLNVRHGDWSDLE